MFALRRFVPFAIFWIILTSNDPGAWLPGLIAAGAATALSLHLLPASRATHVNFRSLASLAPGFLWRSVLGGIDVAWRAFHPRTPLRPTWIRYQVRLPAGGPRVSLGSELSLMPGTLGAGEDGDVMYIHCLDSNQPVLEAIVSEEERIARAIGFDLGGARD
ncbi:MAG: Na+/H+ antiporter subunit E [Beijerinckiaceae bacterium]|nr:Na+/H+ antiporter subunit E [Beijerinckiaceae bacterium]